MMPTRINPSYLWKRLLPLYDERESRAIVRYLLEEVFHLTLTDIYTGALDNMTSRQQQLLENCMIRLKEGEPVQYVVGTAWFCGRPFHVEPGVLIPRPETEALARLVTTWLSNQPGGARGRSVLDVGTGSGCIAITVALDSPGVSVTGWDVSADALRIARHNADKLCDGKKAQVDFVQQDALQAPGDQETWDVVVSNPPYVCERERSTMSTNVLQHEPATALFVPNDDPLRFYRAITSYAAQALKPHGLLAFECNTVFTQEVEEVLTKAGFAETLVLNDIYDKPRIVRGLKP